MKHKLGNMIIDKSALGEVYFKMSKGILKIVCMSECVNSPYGIKTSLSNLKLMCNKALKPQGSI